MLLIQQACCCLKGYIILGNFSTNWQVIEQPTIVICWSLKFEIMAYNCKRTQNSEKECLDGKTTVQPFSCLSWFVLMHWSWFNISFVHFGFFLCCGVWYYVTMYVKITSCTKGNLDCNMYTALIHVYCAWKHYVYMYSVHTCFQCMYSVTRL